MGLVIYSAAVSAAYALIAVADEGTAQALTVAFIALLLVPAFVRRVRASRGWRLDRS